MSLAARSLTHAAELRHVVPGTSCIFEEFLARAPVAAQLMAEAQTRGVLDFDAAWKKFLKAGLGEVGGKCTRHWCAGCPMPSSFVHVSGSPRTRGEECRKGVASDVLLDMVLMGRAVRPYVLVHENVVGFDGSCFRSALQTCVRSKSWWFTQHTRASGAFGGSGCTWSCTCGAWCGTCRRV